jgi:hypothetical protein
LFGYLFMALVRAAVAFFSDIANFFCNSKLPLLLLAQSVIPVFQ